jgi:hypothetical protein
MGTGLLRRQYSRTYFLLERYLGSIAEQDDPSYSKAQRKTRPRGSSCAGRAFEFRRFAVRRSFKSTNGPPRQHPRAVLKSRIAFITIIITPSRCGRYHAWLDGRLLAHSRQPFLDAARAPIALGCDPSATLLLRHVGSETAALRATVGGAARLTVDEDPRPRFRRWPAWDTAPPIEGNTPAHSLDRSPERASAGGAP